MRRLPVFVLFVAACASAPRDPFADMTEEERYYAVLHLADQPGAATIAELRRHVESQEPMTRNAAARALCELGERDAAATLIENLDRDQRTFVTMDAIWHLRALFGSDLGYDPDRGYKNQTERQQAWRAWFARQPFGRPLAPPARVEKPETVALRQELHARLAAWKRKAPDPVPDFQTSYGRAGELFAASRAPDDMALLEAYVGALCRFHPETSRAFNGHALTALNNGDYETAERSYRRALELAPDSSQLWNDIGILLEGLGRLEEALAAYDRACELSPGDDVCWSNRGDVLRKLDRTDEAIAAYRGAEEIAPEKWCYHRLWIGRLQGLRR